MSTTELSHILSLTTNLRTFHYTDDDMMYTQSKARVGKSMEHKAWESYMIIVALIAFAGSHTQNY